MRKRQTIGWLGIAVWALAQFGCNEAPGGAGKDGAALEDGATMETSSGDARQADGSGDDASVDAAVAHDSSGLGDIATGGTILLEEGFDNANLEDRGWYDAPGSTLSTDEKMDGAAAFECVYASGATGCTGGSPGRHAFDETETLYISYYVKYSANYVGSQKAYHPHEFYVVTNADGTYIGPAMTHLTAYVEQVGGWPQLVLQDGLNVDMDCLLLNDGSFRGCDGSFDEYQFTENRSVCACNGIVGDLDRSDCFPYGDGYYSARVWRADQQYFSDQSGPNYKNDWHHVEAYFQMNSIIDGKGVTDGLIRYWYDGRLIIGYDNILMRTGAHPNLAFNQLLVGPYIGDGSPVEQTMWIDKLLVATGRP